MRIDCLSYFNPFKYGGGGEMITRSLIEAGRRRGHTIRLRSVRPRVNECDSSAELYWLVDVFNFPQTLKSRGSWLRFPPDLLKEIAANRLFIHMSNAYVDVCNLGHLPCSGLVYAQCQHKSPAHIIHNLALRDFGRECFALDPLVRNLFSRSAMNVYLSPLHQQTIERILGDVRGRSSFVLKPTIDTSMFYDQGLERDIDYLFVGVIGEAKGLTAMREQFRDADIHFVGKIAPGEKLDFGTYHGSVPYSEIPKYMNRAKYFVFLPRWPEPQGRVVTEAALCGCQLITNHNVGATSFPFNIGNPSNFSNATEEFWDAMEQIPS
ncbi:MAG: glycosyltransferase family 1 protein [Betaproteobacteria bacterium]|nr:glycosyltransferase family 1 protein [Betaproteobacteria bacterium]